MHRTLPRSLSSLGALLFAGLCASALPACTHYRVVTADPPPLDALSAPPEGLGQICILRPHSIGLLLTAPVRDNGLLVGATRGPSYFCYLAHPGAHRVSSKTDSERTVDVAVRPGETHYLEQQIRMGGDRFFRIAATDVPAKLERCDYSLLIEAPGEELAIEAPPAKDGPP
jgi:hypothetical protein